MWVYQCPFVPIRGLGWALWQLPCECIQCILALQLCRYPHVFFDGVTRSLFLVVAFLLFRSRCRGGMEGVGWVIGLGTDKARSALSRQHVPLYSQWGLAVCRATCFGNSSNGDGLQQGEVCFLPPWHYKHAHRHQVVYCMCLWFLIIL